VKRDPREYVDHIRASMGHIDKWVADGRDAFFHDVRTQAAILRKLHELTESVKRLHPLVGEQHPDIPWRDVIGFREVVVHDYLGLNLERVWDIVTEHLPALKPHIDRIAAELGPG
jgi:uncharacterized protein with HEPN domain